MRKSFVFLAAMVGLWTSPGMWTSATAEDKPARPADLMLLDFENADGAKAWTNLDLNPAMLKQWAQAVKEAKDAGKPAPRKPQALPAEPKAKIELTTEGATRGKRALKITFDGGYWPMVATATVPEADWRAYRTLKADVIAPRPCVIGFCAMQEKSRRGEGWSQATSRWDATAFLQAGKNEVLVPIVSRGSTMLPKARGKVVSFEIYMYEPRKGESLIVDNIRLSRQKPPTVPKVQYAALGTDLTAAAARSWEAVAELHRKLKGKWTQPKPRTLEQVEADFAKRCEQLKAEHPRAVMAVFRDGQKGFDPAHPEKVYAGWKDAYVNGHGPDGCVRARSAKAGKARYSEQFMRHRSRMMQVDLSGIPAGSTILAAELVLINPYVKPDAATAKSTMWVAEACNREWDEVDVNAYQYAKEKFWKEISGWSWTGKDPDFLPLFLAYGPSQGHVNAWDFTEAVKYWTDGKHPNRGFFWHNDGQDYWAGGCPTRETEKVKDRPALMVVHVPRK